MAHLSPVEKIKLEKIFSMGSGYVLNFTNNSFSRFIYDTVKINIDSPKYEKYGPSKANRLRALWELEGDLTVGRLTEEMLSFYKAQIGLNEDKSIVINENLFKDCLAISYKLSGKPISTSQPEETEESFLKKEVDEIAISSLNIDENVSLILGQRILEVKVCIKSGAALSSIFLCGSILEGVLLGIAIKYPKEFNQSLISPKDKVSQKVKPLHEWSLNSLIDVAHNIGFLGLDVKKFGHTLRDFRNYIHPFEQMSSGFAPDMHTAEISWKVLKAALHDIYKKIK